MRKSLKRIGRRSPPGEGLIGRTAVGRILGCSKRTVRRREDDGLLHHILEEPDGTRWFDEETIRRLAATGPEAQRRARAKPIALGESCTADEIRAINEAFEANVPHDEIGLIFRKSLATVRHLYARCCRDRGVKKLPPSSRKPMASADYYPDLAYAYPEPERDLPAAPHAEHHSAHKRAPSPPPPGPASARPKVRRELPLSWLTDDFGDDEKK